jgi:serine/threonine protein phosphatase 1
MSRTLVIGDIHGGLKGLKQAISLANVTQNDKLIFLGDYVDGWSESPQVLDFLIELQNQQNCIFIRGNHDDLLQEWLINKTQNYDWFLHGGEATVNAYKGIDEQTIQKHIEFLKQLRNYYIDEENRLFVHAGFTNVKGIHNEYFPILAFWDRTLWETALALDENISKNSPFYPVRLLLYKEIFIGHTPVTKIGKTTPVNKACIWNIDTGAAFKGSITILDVLTKEYWQSEPLYELYFNEKGRNRL